MQSFIRGQRAKLAQLSDRTRRFGVQIALRSERVPVFDFVCFGVDERDQLSDDRFMIFFNQKRAPNDAIVLEELGDQNARFVFDLDLVPNQIARLVFTVSVDGAGTMKDLLPGSLQLAEDGLLYPQILAQYPFSGADFGAESALMLAAIYRKDGDWRFWAQGQGFAGNLGALLNHFGGQESGAGAPAPPVITTQAPPVAVPLPPPASPAPPPSLPASLAPPPVSPPRLATPPSPPISTVSALPPASKSHTALQKLVDATPSGGTLQLSRGEFEGPILLDKPLILEGAGAIVWAHNGPVVRVSSAGVTLRDLGIEATDPDDAPGSKTALYVDAATAPTLERVRVRGQVAGVAAAMGTWKLPPALELGEFASRESSAFEFEIEVPCECELKCTVAGVTLVPARVSAGRFRVQLGASGIGGDTFLAGAVEVWSGGIGRVVPLHGRSLSGAAAARGRELWRVDKAGGPA